MRKRVRSRLVSYYVETVIPIPKGETVLTERLGYQGQWLNSESGTDTATERYGVREDDFIKLSLDGHLDDGETMIPALNVHEADRTESLVEGPIDFEPDPIPSHPITSIPLGEGGELDADEKIHTPDIPPVPLADLAEWQIEEWLKATPVNEVLDAIMESENPWDVSQRVLGAENSATGGEPRQDLLLGIATRLSDGEPQTPAPASTPESQASPAAETPQTPPALEGEPPTEAVLAYAKENMVDLTKVSGTGKNGRITMHDVAAYEKSLS